MVPLNNGTEKIGTAEFCWKDVKPEIKYVLLFIYFYHFFLRLIEDIDFFKKCHKNNLFF